MQHERMMSVISTAYACIPHLSQSRSMKHEEVCMRHDLAVGHCLVNN